MVNFFILNAPGECCNRYGKKSAEALAKAGDVAILVNLMQQSKAGIHTYASKDFPRDDSLLLNTNLKKI